MDWRHAQNVHGREHSRTECAHGGRVGVQSVHDRDPFGTESVHGQKHPPSCTISVTGDSLPCTLFALFCTRWEPDGDEKCARRGHSLPRLLLVRVRSSPYALLGIPGQDGARRVRFPSRTGVHRCGVSRSGRKAGVEVRVERLADGGPDAGAHAVRARYHGAGSWEGGAAWAYARTPGKAPSKRP